MLEIKIEGFKIRPWTDDQIIALVPIFNEMFNVIDRAKINLKDINQAEKVGWLTLPWAVEIISITLDFPREKILSWSLEKVTRVAGAILNLNNRFERFSLPMEKLRWQYVNQ